MYNNPFAGDEIRGNELVIQSGIQRGDGKLVFTQRCERGDILSQNLIIMGELVQNR
jgi:hypothetical protein